MPDTTWTALPHRPLTAIDADRLWMVEGDLPRLPIGRRMMVIRLADGRLVVHSAIALDDDGMTTLDALGPVGFIVVPNGFHRMDAARFSHRYPDAQVVCPRGARKAVEARVAVAGGYELLPEDPHLRWELLEGTKEREGVFAVTTSDGISLVFNDAVFNLPDKLPGFGGFMTKLLGSTGGPKVTKIAKRFLVGDRAALADHLRRLSDTPSLRRVIPGHGAVIDTDAAAVLKRVADDLSPRASPAVPG